eukprot:m.90452 g.90452  ORF g.90452 m.90452 type:complete len:52 (+) comp12916_c0_seq3:2571-2726(+)
MSQAESACSEQDESKLKSMSMKDLKALLKSKGLKIKARPKKQDLINTLLDS